jgi:hypothetical protein
MQNTIKITEKHDSAIYLEIIRMKKMWQQVHRLMVVLLELYSWKPVYALLEASRQSTSQTMAIKQGLNVSQCYSIHCFSESTSLEELIRVRTT